ncbi:eukaryotic translation initiation factor 4G-like [Abeliophyllum distichum]|uniref:Eukaryotic translation initiation factor 4G-like n=1 Tax=Abeliophyllum distichum TaxID=126358 RepID=A0ABD1RSE8_9LAMI
METAEQKVEESSGCCFDDARVAGDLVTPTSIPDDANPESSDSVIGVSAQYDGTCTLDASLSRPDSIDTTETTVNKLCYIRPRVCPHFNSISFCGCSKMKILRIIIVACFLLHYQVSRRKPCQSMLQNVL